MSIIRLISPIDGSVYAERAALPLDAAQAVVARGACAQAAWAALPLASADRYGHGGHRRAGGHGPRHRAGTGLADGPPGALWRRIWRRARAAAYMAQIAPKALAR
jgi:hypothetical protein